MIRTVPMGDVPGWRDGFSAPHKSSSSIEGRENLPDGGDKSRYKSVFPEDKYQSCVAAGGGNPVRVFSLAWKQSKEAIQSISGKLMSDLRNAPNSLHNVEQINLIEWLFLHGANGRDFRIVVALEWVVRFWFTLVWGMDEKYTVNHILEYCSNISIIILEIHFFHKSNIWFWSLWGLLLKELPNCQIHLRKYSDRKNERYFKDYVFCRLR